MIPVSVSAFRQFLTMFPGCLCDFSMGLGYGWVAPTLEQRKDSDEFPFTAEECALIASLSEFGRGIGTVIIPLLVDTIGRKNMYTTSAVIYFLCWLAVLSTRMVWTLYCVRFVFGVTEGLNETVASIYLSEICSPQIRGVFASLVILSYFTGILVAFVLATYLSYGTAALVITSIQASILFSLPLLKEPPHFRIMKGEFEKAERVFYWLRGIKTHETTAEFEEISKYVQQQTKKSSFREICTSRANYKSIIIVTVVSSLMAATGYAAVLSFVSMAFTSTDFLSPNEFTIIFGLCQLVSVGLSSLFIESFGRRSILMASLVGSAAMHGATALLYYVHERLCRIPYFPWLIFVTITSYGIVYSMAILPILFLTHGELFPQRVKAIGSCLAVTATSVVNFVITGLFLNISQRWGIHWNFVFYSTVSLVATVYAYFEFPEARGKSAFEIQKMFEK